MKYTYSVWNNGDLIEEGDVRAINRYRALKKIKKRIVESYLSDLSFSVRKDIN